MGAISGDINSNPMRCVDANDLASRPTGSKETGDLAYVASLEGNVVGPYFFLRRNSAEPPSAAVINSADGVQWLSLKVYGIGSSGSGSTSSFVYRPGDPAPKPNVFTTWADVVAAAAGVDGVKSVLLSPEFAPMEIPAGDWDFGPGFTMMEGSPVEGQGGGSVTASLDDGVTFKGVTSFKNLLLIVANSNPLVPVISSLRDLVVGLGADSVFYQFETSGVFVLGGGDFLAADAPSTSIYMISSAFVTSIGPHGFVVNKTGSDLTFGMFGNSALQNDSIAGAGIVANLISPATVVEAQPATTGLTLLNSSRSELVFYDDTLVAPHFGAGNVQAAIDALKVFLANPVVTTLTTGTADAKTVDSAVHGPTTTDATPTALGTITPPDNTGGLVLVTVAAVKDDLTVLFSVSLKVPYLKAAGSVTLGTVVPTGDDPIGVTAGMSATLLPSGGDIVPQGTGIVAMFHWAFSYEYLSRTTVF